ncbi:lanthionine synthetase LanC family protein, partial [Streptomyces sp. NPDC059556]|uniref:lanthionine synthetase LanC family protein n=1 Tax=Streptomyces sp. NPDC059556 TaxID=3346863 RepID=UPI0036B6F473
LVALSTARERRTGTGSGAGRATGSRTGAGTRGGPGSDPAIVRAARACADRLVVAVHAAATGPANDEPASLGRGFTEGAAGIGWALMRFAEAEESAADSAGGRVEGTVGGGAGRRVAERYRLAGLSAIRAAVAADAPDGGPGPGGGRRGVSAPTPGGGPAGAARASAWCRGDAGIALAVLDAPGALAEPHLAAWARGTAERLGQNGAAPDDSLCHGEAGLCELLGHTALPEGRPHWVRRAGALLASVEESDARSGAPDGVPHPGLLTGLAGIGHGLLRAGFPERVPSLLLLRTTEGYQDR